MLRTLLLTNHHSLESALHNTQFVSQSPTVKRDNTLFFVDLTIFIFFCLFLFFSRPCYSSRVTGNFANDPHTQVPTGSLTRHLLVVVVVAGLTEVAPGKCDDVAATAVAGALGVGHVDRSVDGGRGLDINESDLAEVGDRHDERCRSGFSTRLLCGGRVLSVDMRLLS